MSFKLSDGSTLQQNFIQDSTIIDRWVGGNLLTTGNNVSGQLCQSDVVSRSTPTNVNGTITWAQVDGGVFSSTAHTGAVKSDGTLWTCGYNLSGTLGVGDLINRSSPTQVGGLTTWKQVSCGYAHMAAVKTDGNLWTWGRNGRGQLGNNTTSNTSSPVQVMTACASVSCGYDRTAVVKTNGTLWICGYGNNNGALGLGATTATSSLTQIGILTNWKMVSLGHKFFGSAVKTDGTMWTWGQNSFGQLGQVSATTSSPVQVGSLTNWKYVSAGDNCVLAIKIDGTLWGWGGNVNGQLGQSDTINRSSPTQIGSSTNWKYVSASKLVFTTSNSSVFATKTDGTLWGWGYNANAQLGTGDSINRSSPVQIGVATNWKYIAVTERSGMTTTFSEDYL